MSEKLLTRNQFRLNCFKRDGFKCVVCKEPAIFDSEGEPTNLDAHHIVERKLFENGGYYENNAATVCEPCHIKAEQTVIGCDELRKLCGIKTIIYPEHYYQNQEIDKWGNFILSDGRRIKGELFYEESVQKILEPVLHLFETYTKYPRTLHLPWSPGGKDKEERVISSLDHFKDLEVVVLEKLDGENTTIYRDHIHARSLDPMDNHPSRSRIKSWHSEIKNDLPENYRFCMENVFAKHSIHYKHLLDFHYLLSVWNENNFCLSWDETIEWAELLEIPTPPVLFRGIFNEEQIKQIYKPVSQNGDECEGYVIRPTREFSFPEFRRFCLKYVRENHVQTNNHWKHQAIVKNELNTKD